MPTAAKLAAAILYAALAWWVSQMIKPMFPDGTDLGRFSEFNALIGLVIGWRVAGGRARTTWPNAVSYGLTSSLSMAIMALFLHSVSVMLGQTVRRVYEGPVEAVVDVARIMAENAHFVAAPQILVTLVLGGILAGLATEWVARNYR